MSYRILVVDDEPDIREIVSILLEKNGYETRLAQNGSEAVQLVRQEGPFDLVIMDIMMPEMDGLGACQTIRSLALLDLNTIPRSEWC